MKTRWHIAKKTEGVSPVIAVILMVAITVVLAAVLYVMVSGWINQVPPTPKGAFDFNQVGPVYQGGKNYSGNLIELTQDEIAYSDVSMTINMNDTGAASAGACAI